MRNGNLSQLLSQSAEGFILRRQTHKVRPRWPEVDLASVLLMRSHFISGHACRPEISQL